MEAGGDARGDAGEGHDAGPSPGAAAALKTRDAAAAGRRRRGETAGFERRTNDGPFGVTRPDARRGSGRPGIGSIKTTKTHVRR